MDLWTALRIYATRWYVAVPVLLMSFYAAYAIGQTINPTYETAGSILLVPPLEQAPVETREEYEPIVNPCLRPGNGPRGCADAIARILLSEGEQRRFEAAGLSPDYDISIPRDSLIIDYTVVGDSKSQVTETLDELVRLTNSELLGIQQTTNTPANQIISVEPLFLAEEPEEFSGGRLKVTAALALVSVVASASMAFLADSLAGRRRGSVRRAVRTEPTAATGHDGGPDTTRTGSRHPIDLVAEDDDTATTETDNRTEGHSQPTADSAARSSWTNEPAQSASSGRSSTSKRS
ncbi:MAG: hypothetical protein GY929_14300 [Actinomycetia bacterium]|nr:hypothetical protein [Actinomycetes bacterium]